MISNPSFSADGKKIAFSVHQANLEDDAYTSDVWISSSDGSGVTRFTYGGRDYDPVWSPNGNEILFLSKRSLAKDEKGNELYVLSAGGGEARRIVKRKEGIDGPQWAGDSNSIYFLSAVAEEEKDDVRVVRRIGLWYNGKGFTYNSRTHVFVVNLQTGETRQLTTGNFDVTEVRPSHDGKRVAYLAALDDMKPYIVDLYVRELETGDELKLTSSDMSVTTLARRPDGGELAFTGNRLAHGFASHDHVWVVRAGGGSPPVQVERADRNKANTLNSDVRTKSHGPTHILWEGDFVYFLQAEGGAVHLLRLRLGKDAELVIGGERGVEGFGVRGKRVAFVAMDSHHPEELYLKETSERPLTSLNSEVRKEVDHLPPREFSFTASDGVRIDGWVFQPPSHLSKEKIPAILYVHGGPKTAFGYSLMHELQVYTASGFAVICTNPRGSDGYSEEFADIRGEYGKRDFMDLMEALDHVIENFPFVDGARVAIAGGSYGGVMIKADRRHTR